MGLDSMTKPTTPGPAASAQQIEAIRGFYGVGPQTSDWFTVTQEVVDQFGQATGDSEWIHTDPERARRDSPYGGTIAHGFWTLSMLVHLSRLTTGTDYPPGAAFGINYGLNRVRFPGPAPVGGRIRLRSQLVDIAPREGGRYLVTTENTIEVAGQDKPAVVAEWLALLVYPAG
jgi:acyl dehydratase